jgi:hypothetical protein
MRYAIACCILALGSLCHSLSAATPAKLIVEPRSALLTGNFDRLQLRVSAAEGDRSLDVTRSARYSTSTPKLLRVTETGQVIPLAIGKGTVSVEHDGTQIDVPVTVTGITREPVVSFNHDVIAVFNRVGCNQGACHAAQYGQGGFKLSLLGYAPEEDFPQLVRDRFQRRVSFMNPEESLFLLKGTLEVAHQGGRRMTRDSFEYELLKTWVETGAPGPVEKEPEVVGLEVSPREQVYRIGQAQQLRVTARYSDGATHDVTHRVKYDSLSDGIAKVDPSGYVTATGSGQAGVMIRYLGQAIVSLVVVPYRESVDLAGFRPASELDQLVMARWKRLGLKPSPLCSDEQFIRRAYLDAIGTLPTPERVEKFAASKEPKKRETLVDELLGLTGDPSRDVFVNEWSAYWALKWGDLLLNNSRKLGAGMWALNNWLRQSLRENKPMDRFVREIITAEGPTRDVGPANYYLTSRDPVDLVDTTAQVFLGVRLQCAKCHHHPFEVYSQSDYYGLAAFFTRINIKNVADFGSQNGGVSAVRVVDTGSIKHPRTKEVMLPTPLLGKPITDSEVRDPRRLLADWMTSPDNRLFSRNIANRIWGYFMGTGLVEPIDDVRATNPPSNPELLDRLADRFVEDGYDLRKLMRRIMTSQVYQLSSTPNADSVADTRFYSHYNVKRLPAEVLLDAIDYACGTREKFAGMPLGTRAIELPDPNFASYFLDTLGRPLRASACECERTSDPNLAQALQIANGELINVKLADPKNRISALLNGKTELPKAVAELYSVTLSRRPTSAEVNEGLAIIDRGGSEREGLEDLLWALCNSREFLFNH